MKPQPSDENSASSNLATAPLASTLVELPEQTPEAAAAAAAQAVKALRPDENERRDKLIGVGLAMPGLIDVECGICLVSHRFGWKEVPIARMVADRVRVPVRVDNDVNAFATAQQLFGHGRQRRSVLALIIGIGVGPALIFNGQIHRGARYAAGEVGFALEVGFRSPEVRTTWGSRYAEPAMCAEWERIQGARDCEPKLDLQEAALRGDPDAVHFLGEIGRAIGERLATMIALVDPDVVIVGGEAVRFGQALIGPLLEAVRACSFETPPPIEIDWDNNVWSRGASALAIQPFFDVESAAGLLGADTGREPRSPPCCRP